MPPRIEKWVMEMQGIDYELVCKPGKDKADPPDYLSRHPLPETGDDSTQKIIKWTVNTKHAVFIMRIREETLKDDAKVSEENHEGRLVGAQVRQRPGTTPSGEATVVNRRINFQRTTYGATSNPTGCIKQICLSCFWIYYTYFFFSFSLLFTYYL